MQRIAAILVLFVLLMPAPLIDTEPPLRRTAIQLHAEPLPPPSPEVQRAYGPLRLEGLWRLSSPVRAFGGISALFVGEDGQFTGLNDSGQWARFRLDGPPKGTMAALPRMALAGEHRRQNDNESMARDPVTGTVWAGFEVTNRICRYSPDLARVTGCVQPEAMRDWPEQGGAESLARLGDGRFLAIGELAYAPGGGHDVVLWAGDPVDPRTPPPVHMRYIAPTGYRPTDALWLGGDRLLVLTRRMTVFDWFTAKLTLVRLPKLEAGAVLKGEVIASFERPGPADNLEALALGHEKAGPVLWIASDDNHLVLQRSLLFKFALPRDWVSDARAP
ncbi:MAG: esterase-like activity of phytase family protein [Sphingobium sp.]|nr:esterase-like activity of phytase family protein [Sphingobium sp.]